MLVDAVLKSRTACCADQKLWEHAGLCMPENTHRNNNLPITITNAVCRQLLYQNVCELVSTGIDKVMKIIFMYGRSAAEMQVRKEHTAKCVTMTDANRERGTPLISQGTQYMLLVFSSSLPCFTNQFL